MKKRKKRLKKRRLIFLILITILIIHLYNFLSTSIIPNIENFHSYSNYKIIKENSNPNYSGKGQEFIKDKDGYFTTFTTNSPYKKTYIEYKQNGDSSWSKNEYWGGNMIDNGCGITSLSIILSGYNKNYTPEDLRKKYYPVLNNEKISKELSSTFGIENTDFYYDSVHLSKENFIAHLASNRPILICVWNKPNNNRWTTLSHYMVLLATDEKNMVYVSNPNGRRK